jgi:hypothetical protein
MGTVALAGNCLAVAREADYSPRMTAVKPGLEDFRMPRLTLRDHPLIVAIRAESVEFSSRR